MIVNDVTKERSKHFTDIVAEMFNEIDETERTARLMYLESLV